MNATTVAVDLAKTVFERAISDEQGRLCAGGRYDGLIEVFERAISDEQGRLVERKRLSREGFARFFVNRPPCRIVMEVCGAAHHTTGHGRSRPRVTRSSCCHPSLCGPMSAAIRRTLNADHRFRLLAKRRSPYTPVRLCPQLHE